MSPFYGELTRWSADGARLELHFPADRFPSGEITIPAALDITAEKLANQDAVVARLRSLEQREPALAEVPLEAKGEELTIIFEFDPPLVLQGGTVTVSEGIYDARDYERLVSRFSIYLKDLEDHMTAVNGAVNEADRLCRNQLERLKVKSENHDVGSTARTLYDQHIAFILRLIERFGNPV